VKKANRKQKLVVGAFVAFIVLLGAVATLFFGEDLTMFKHNSRFFAAFKTTAGLHVGAPLKMGGVDVGSVEAITIDTEGAIPRILLTLIVYSPHDQLIKADTEASLDTQGMLGDKFINLTTGSASSPPIAPGSFLRAKESVEMSAVVTQSADIIETASRTMTKIDTFVDSLPNGAAMKIAAADFQTSAQAMKSLLMQLNAKESGLRMLNDQAIAASLRATLASLQSTSSHLDSISTKIDSGNGTLGALVNDPALYDDMRTLMGRANRSKAAKFIIQQMLKNSDGPSDLDKEKGGK
jgi:phospholipid/cholesterol/gamma-HCH transport system substrate-binding protein